MAVISADEFKRKSVAIIPIPGFDEGETYEIKVQKLSIVGLISSGKIPNSLMQVVKDAFERIKSEDEKDAEDSSIMDKAGDIGRLLDIVCTEAMVEPRFEDVKDVMNDAQKIAVFQFTQGGVEQVKSFPTIEGDIRRPNDVENVPSKTE